MGGVGSAFHCSTSAQHLLRLTLHVAWARRIHMCHRGVFHYCSTFAFYSLCTSCSGLPQITVKVYCEWYIDYRKEEA